MAAHRYWRIYIKAGNSTFIQIAELELRSSLGGSDLTGSGTASASTATAGAAANAFDNNSSTFWGSTNGDSTQAFLAYDFGSGNAFDIVQIVITASTSGGAGPKDFALQYSDDGIAWSYSDLFQIAQSWTSGQSQTYAMPAAPATPPTPVTTWRINCGSVSAVSGWNDDSAPSSNTITSLVDSTGATTAIAYAGGSWDTASTGGAAHADLPLAVSGSYLQWFSTARTLNFSGLNNTKTYTLTLYATGPSPAAEWLTWTAGGVSRGLVRGSKTWWTGLTPTTGTISFTDVTTPSTSRSALTAVLLSEEGAAVITTRRRPVIALCG